MQYFQYRSQAVPGSLLAIAICLPLGGCASSQAHSEPSVEISRVPAAGDGSPDNLQPVAGRVTGARPGDRIVLFARSGVWWVQPFAANPFTEVHADSTWNSTTHPGSEYAALLVDSRYHPPSTLKELPEKGGPVLALASVEGGTPPIPPRTLQFSGYQWEIRETSSDAGGSRNFYDPANAWTDKSGFLHLKIARQAERPQEGQWMSAEVKLSRSLGYGSYRFVVQDIAHLEPAAVFGLLTWDDFGPAREMDIEISRWGEPEDKNAQYVIQPYVVPANSVRFTAPAGTLTYWIDWQPGRVAFKTVRGSSPHAGASAAAEHIFTSGVPSPGNERIHMIHYVFDNKRNPMQHESEVVIEKFEFLP